MAREHADVVMGGRTIGFAYVEFAGADGSVSLASTALLLHPSAVAPDLAHLPACRCRSEDLVFAQVRSRRGGTWSLGVKACVRHMSIRNA
jgi:hypothetical protein